MPHGFYDIREAEKRASELNVLNPTKLYTVQPHRYRDGSYGSKPEDIVTYGVMERDPNDLLGPCFIPKALGFVWFTK